MKKDDWRLTNQMNYLSNKKLIKVSLLHTTRIGNTSTVLFVRKG